jgi:hypothetical protein
MNRPKKTSTTAQASTSHEAEAAVKLIRPTFKSTKSDPQFKDGEEPPPPDHVMSYDIQVGINGFFVTISYSDIEVPDERYIAHTMDEVVELLRSSF